jgi:hypothetical protein
MRWLPAAGSEGTSPLSWYASITSPLTRSVDNETVTARLDTVTWCYCLVSNCTTRTASMERIHGNRKRR